MRIDPIARESESHGSGKIQVEACTHSKEKAGIALMHSRRRDTQALEQQAQVSREHYVRPFVHASKARANEESDFFPLAYIELRSGRERVSGRVEGNVN